MPAIHEGIIREAVEKEVDFKLADLEFHGFYFNQVGMMK
jgi:hypothetical protein